MMKTNILILSLLCSGLNAGAQQAYLSREEYRDKVEAYSQILKQQHLKTFASTEARKIASTGFLPQIDITAEGTANLNHLDQWNSPKGDYHPYTYQALATLTQPLYTGGSLIAQKKVAQAEEALDQLTTELTLDQIHYQSDAVYWNASAARAGLKAAATFQDIVQQQYDIIQDRFDDGANGKLGKESALKEIPDIIVSDIMMPVMDGNEMCRELKKDVRTSHIPIILLTAKDSLRDKEEGAVCLLFLSGLF